MATVYFVRTSGGVRGPYCVTCRKKVGHLGDRLDGACVCFDPADHARSARALKRYWSDPSHRAEKAEEQRNRWAAMSPDERAAHVESIKRGLSARNNQRTLADPTMA